MNNYWVLYIIRVKWYRDQELEIEHQDTPRDRRHLEPMVGPPPDGEGQ